MYCTHTDILHYVPSHTISPSEFNASHPKYSNFEFRLVRWRKRKGAAFCWKWEHGAAIVENAAMHTHMYAAL